MKQFKEVSNGMTKKHFDLLVIGAGSTGSSIAYEATRRGLNVALLDARDIGGGTSCKSTKLLHGGVRYLELAFKNFDLAQLRLVREALIERDYWLKQAPFLSRRIELAIPTQSCFETGYYRIGLGLYDALAGSRSIGRSRLLSNNKLSEAFPRLKCNTQRGVVFSDGQFNDARLNLLLALTAEKAGATLLSRCKVIDLEKHSNGKISGATIETKNKEIKTIDARTIVNATGIHADKLRKKVDPSLSTKLLISRGIHLVLKENLCAKNIGLFLPKTDDGRILFLLPFFGRTLIGTTDTACHHEAASSPSKEEELYLINHLERWFPNSSPLEIKSCWAGGRPLLSSSNENTNSSKVVREHEIETLPCGLISAMGGKWTTCRSMALDTIKAIETALGRSLPNPKPLPLIGTHLNSNKTKDLLLKQRHLLKEYLPDSYLLEKQIDHLEGTYGLEAFKIIQKSSKELLEPLSEVIPICRAEIQQAITNEHALTPTDILARRCRLAMVDFEEAERLLPIVRSYLGDTKYKDQDLDLKK